MAMIDIGENHTSNVEDILAIAEARATAENLLGNTLSRHRSAINALADALNGSPDRIVRPGYWVSLYARAPSTSTLISNMKFVASILEWTETQDYANKAQYQRIAQAIRLALAVKA
ncbi:hypothetical protein NFK58_12805 [Citrobacter portucalensis]|uniref:hypothetical protein n=1 Tax=Citrobacter portucalensis TaxID=1639133 RepID=UPI00242D9EB8|nr:hypothetical protein [Citrobacter portucalensis]WFZ22187.1 hypothetical protein NFK58_12805 [Citrobacter portucalensis]